MRRCIRFITLYGACVLALLACGLPVVPAQAAQAANEHALCAPDAGGAMRVMVLMPPAQWSGGGFDVRRGQTSLGHIRADTEATASLEPGAAAALAALPERARAEKSDSVNVIVYMRLLSDWGFARAAGMGAALAGQGRDKSTLSIVPLDASGQPQGHALRCQPSSITSPPAPQDLRAAMHAEGPALYWQAVKQQPPVPVLSFRVWRSDGGKTQALIEHPPFMPPERARDDVAYLDDLAPLEQTLTYQVAQVDALGRESARASVTLYAKDLAALRPPARLDAKAEGGNVELRWTPGDNPHTTGYVVERALLATGPFELLTPDGLARDATTYRDQDLSGGTVYYYRVRAMGPRGDLGPASDPVGVQPRSTQAPAAPEGLKAEAGNTRVRLQWALAPAAVAGYIIERRAEGSPSWSRVNQELWPATRYDDALGAQTGGTLYYRVTAVSQDNLDSPPSPIVKVILRDTTPPLPPRIVSASGVDGRVQLEVHAAQPVADTARIYVLRSGSAEAEGLVIGKPLDGAATRYADDWVQPGKTYWYHLVAYDAAGNRSADSDVVAVRVGAPPLPQPAAPRAHFESKPLPRVVVDFAAPPKGLAVLVQRSSDGVHWQNVAGSTTESPAQDLDPATGRAQYRVRYRATDGSVGPASTSIEVQHD